MSSLDLSALSDDQITELFAALVTEVATRSDVVQVAWKTIYETKRAEIAAKLDAQKVSKQAEIDAKLAAAETDRLAEAAKQQKFAALKKELCEKLHDVTKANVTLNHSAEIALLEKLRPIAATGGFSVGVRAAWDGRDFVATREEAVAIVEKSCNYRLSMISEHDADSVGKKIAELEKKISITHELKPLKFEIWEKGSERRVYASFVDAKFGDNAISYFETGNSRNKPGSIEVNQNISCTAAREWCQLLLSKFRNLKVYDSSEWI